MCIRDRPCPCRSVSRGGGPSARRGTWSPKPSSPSTSSVCLTALQPPPGCSRASRLGGCWWNGASRPAASPRPAGLFSSRWSSRTTLSEMRRAGACG
eukprot:3068088-Rhodomonas_salina.1